MNMQLDYLGSFHKQPHFEREQHYRLVDFHYNARS